MKCHWIIENFIDAADSCELVDAVRASGRECYVIGKRENLDFDASQFSENECVMFQGSIQMGRHIQKKLPFGCYPILYCTEDNYLCSKYYPYFKDILFNDKHVFVTVGELKANRFDYYANFGKDAMIFIRPDRGDKIFSGQLLDLEDFDRFWKNNLVSTATDDDLAIVSTPKNIRGEWRFVCCTESIIACSTYSYQGKITRVPFAPPGATALCKEVLDRGYFPDKVFCVDVAEDCDGSFWLLELTSFSSAGFYACDKKAIAERVSGLVEVDYFQHKVGPVYDRQLSTTPD